jgi:Flp pilus assembly protein TadD
VTVQDLAGHCLEQLGRAAEALERFERALALKPGDPHQQGDVTRVRAALAR